MANAESIRNTEFMHHLHVKPGDVGRYVIIPGDPGRCEKIAAFFDDPKQVAYFREYNTYTGYLDGEKVSVTSTGIGGPSASIAIEELHMAGADTFIRVGTAGGMQLEIIGGDVVIATGAIRKEGTTVEYLPIEFPAVPDYDVTVALVDAAKKLGATYHTGVVECKDSFYGQHSPGRMPVADELLYKWNAWVAAGAKCSEMESAAAFIVGSVLGTRMGSILLVAANQEREKAGMDNPRSEDTQGAIKIAVEAIRDLIKKDKAAGR